MTSHLSVLGAPAIVLILFLIYLTWESMRLHHARQQLCHRIHINGTRGKSSVARLIHHVLSQTIPTAAKITGSKPVYIDPSGKERPIVRQGAANIREQVGYILRASNDKAEAIVFECMALRPHFQNICEHSVIRATVGVITNARPDHLDVMGPSVADVARALSETVPMGGLVVTAEREHWKIIRNVCRRRLSAFIRVTPAMVDAVPDSLMEKFSYFEHKENVAVAMAVLTQLGISRQQIGRLIWSAKPDVGAWRMFAIQHSAQSPVPFPPPLAVYPSIFVNGLAANDPASSELIWANSLKWMSHLRRRVLLLNLRDDRMDRTLLLFSTFSTWQFDDLILTGDYQASVLKAAEESFDVKIRKHYLGPICGENLGLWLSRHLASDAVIVALGNLGGAGYDLTTFAELNWTLLSVAQIRRWQEFGVERLQEFERQEANA